MANEPEEEAVEAYDGIRVTSDGENVHLLMGDGYKDLLAVMGYHVAQEIGQSLLDCAKVVETLEQERLAAQSNQDLKLN